MKKHIISNQTSQVGFSLIEVVLAIGIFLVTVLALVGLLGPTLQSVDEVEKTDEVSSVVNTVNAFLQNSPAIKTTTTSKFDTIFNAVLNDGSATIFVFRSFKSTASNEILLRVGFFEETLGDPSASLVAGDFMTESTVLAAGPIYRVVLSPSSVTPNDYLVGDPPVRNSDEVYQLTDPLVANYLEGYFAMEVRIYAEDAGPSFVPNFANGISDLVGQEPIFTYNTAIVR